jgi:hypothetical protein
MGAKLGLLLLGRNILSPNTPSWRSAQLKHRDNFTFTFTQTKGFWEQSVEEDIWT